MCQTGLCNYKQDYIHRTSSLPFFLAQFSVPWLVSIRCMTVVCQAPSVVVRLKSNAVTRVDRRQSPHCFMDRFGTSSSSTPGSEIGSALTYSQDVRAQSSWMQFAARHTGFAQVITNTTHTARVSWSLSGDDTQDRRPEDK